MYDFEKVEGPNFCWPLVLIQSVGANKVYQFLFNVNKNLAEGGHGPMDSSKYTSGGSSIAAANAARAANAKCS